MWCRDGPVPAGPRSSRWTILEFMIPRPCRRLGSAVARPGRCDCRVAWWKLPSAFTRAEALRADLPVALSTSSGILVERRLLVPTFARPTFPRLPIGPLRFARLTLNCRAHACEACLQKLHAAAALPFAPRSWASAAGRPPRRPCARGRSTCARRWGHGRAAPAGLPCARPARSWDQRAPG